MKAKLTIRLMAPTLLAMWLHAVDESTQLRAAEVPKPQLVGGNIDWVYDYEQGQRLSKASGKPMFVVFRCER